LVFITKTFSHTLQPSKPKREAAFTRTNNFIVDNNKEITNSNDFTAHHYDNGTLDKLLYNTPMVPT
jgi:hypothetical protein